MCYNEYLHELHHDICHLNGFEFNFCDSHCESQCEGHKQMNTLHEMMDFIGDILAFDALRLTLRLILRK